MNLNVQVTEAPPRRIAVAIRGEKIGASGHPELAGMYLESNINGDPDSFTIWIEDGK